MSHRLKKTAVIAALSLSTALVSGCSDMGSTFARRSAATPVTAGAGSAGFDQLAQARRFESRGSNGFETGDIAANAPSRPFRPQNGVAMWDGDLSRLGMTASHPALPRHSWARVTNLDTGKTTLVKITSNRLVNRGSDVELSRDAAAALGLGQNSRANIRIEAADPHSTAAYQAPQPSRRVAATSAQTRGVAIPPAVSAVAPTRTAPQPRQASASFAPKGPQLMTGSIPRATASTQVAQARQAVQAEAGYTPRFLQVGSFSDRANAEKALMQLKTRALDPSGPFIQPVTVSGRTFYRVRLGPLTSRAAAERALIAAKAQGYEDARLLQR
ncbi:MAG: SPOR domain-containing protein [Neomegalonema sp.]|nr:SPOR domain-containing protein [Neomegalonema sp.]